MKLAQKWVWFSYVTLHVWLGTFKPVDTHDIREYDIHEETIIISKSLLETISLLKKQGKRIIAVGTTVARVLETLPYIDIPNHPYILSIEDIGDDMLQIKTKIFIYPEFQWRVVDALLTNFHLPWSTLLMLVASFVGYDTMLEIYDYAIKHNYRFFSFWDAMFLERKR
jgi:S-adenosylmethionine:tRNA ribosyltransferase-isomerase